MPDPLTLLLFAAASVVLLVIPGPTIALVVARALTGGRALALPLVLGVGLGDLVAATLALAGAGALLAASAAAFAIAKGAGAAYLIWLGLRMILAPPPAPADAPSASAGRSPAAWPAFRDGFVVTVLNPKGILFFVAFVPQFIDPARGYVGQAATFVALFTLLGMVNGLAYALGADALRRVIRRPAVLAWTNRAGGVAIAGAGIATLFARRPA